MCSFCKCNRDTDLTPADPFLTPKEQRHQIRSNRSTDFVRGNPVENYICNANNDRCCTVPHRTTHALLFFKNYHRMEPLELDNTIHSVQSASTDRSSLLRIPTDCAPMPDMLRHKQKLTFRPHPSSCWRHQWTLCWFCFPLVASAKPRFHAQWRTRSPREVHQPWTILQFCRPRTPTHKTLFADTSQDTKVDSYKSDD